MKMVRLLSYLTIGICITCLIFSCKNLKVENDVYNSLVHAREIIVQQRDSITDLYVCNIKQ